MRVPQPRRSRTSAADSRHHDLLCCCAWPTSPRTNTFTLVRLLPISDQEKDIEILALRHQLIVLQPQAGKPAFTQTDHVMLAGLPQHLPVQRLRQLLLLARPDTLLRWHRDLIRRRHAATCAPKRRRRPAPG